MDFSGELLFPEIEAFDDLLVSRAIINLDVFQEFPSLADQLQETPAGMVILPMGLEMLGQEIDPLRQDGNLNGRRAGIRPMDLEISDEFLFLLFDDRHLANHVDRE